MLVTPLLAILVMLGGLWSLHPVRLSTTRATSGDVSDQTEPSPRVRPHSSQPTVRPLAIGASSRQTDSDVHSDDMRSLDWSSDTQLLLQTALQDEVVVEASREASGR